MAPLRYDVQRGLVAVDAAEVGGDADRAAEIAAGLEIGKAGGERCGTAAR